MLSNSSNVPRSLCYAAIPTAIDGRMQISGDCPLRSSLADRVLSDILNETMSIYIDGRIYPEWKWHDAQHTQPTWLHR